VADTGKKSGATDEFGPRPRSDHPGERSVDHEIVSREEWLRARTELLAKEKALTRLRDQLAAERRALPWVRIDKPYVFDAPQGKLALGDLFRGRSQLFLKHFMLPPGQANPCVGCSFEADHIEGALVHLERHDVAYVAVSRAPLPEIQVVKKRMGWRFEWVSSFGTDFNYDFDVSFTPQQIESGQAFYNYRMGPVPLEDLSGNSVFYKNPAGEIFHTYSAFGRGAEEILGTYMCLDLTPKGRNENGPSFSLTDWVRLHDRYDEPGTVDSLGRYTSATPDESCCGG
jgi:predicted dithiol-disulfide oxidoreductase (DUF899 family)